MNIFEFLDEYYLYVQMLMVVFTLVMCVYIPKVLWDDLKKIEKERL